MTTFKELGLNSEIVEGLNDLEFIEPTPIQEKVIPFILESKKDLIALAQTGTGKTAAFGLPILNKIKLNEKDLQAIILCPTRELCLQISQDIKKFAKHSKEISITEVYGGARIDFQIKALKRGVNIVVGTPGRVHDLIRRKVLHLQTIKWVVLDEADEMLDMGFKDDLDAILEQTPKSRQTLLFSATMSASVNSIAQKYMTSAQEISIGTKNIGAENVSHEYYVVGARDRFEALKRILDSLPGVYGLLFCRTRRETQDVADKLKRAHYDTEALHGDVSQSMRTKIMDRFKNKDIRLLVATDVAARGIDVNNLSHVINYNLPDQDGSYTHRSGRTGRAKKKGISISILSPSEVRRIRVLEKIIGKSFEYKQVPNEEDVCNKQVDNFLEEIKTIEIKENSNEKVFLEIFEKLKKINKEDLIKYLITQKFDYLLDACKNSRNLNVTAKAVNAEKKYGDNVSLKINFGKKHGFDVKTLFRLINSNKQLKGIDIGRVDLMPDCSYFSVEPKFVELMIKHLKETNFIGKKIFIERGNKKINYSRKRKSNSGKYRSKRKRYK